MLVLTNGLLIDGLGGEPVPKATVVVEGNRISACGPQVQYPESATVVDLKGRTILPGLIDTHIHAGGTVELKPGKPNFGGADFTNDFADARESCIHNGVTSFRSGGDFFPDIKLVRDKVAAGKLIGPRIFFHGPIFQPPNGHPAYTVWQADPIVLKYAARFVDDPAVAREEVKKLVAEGVDYIKVIVGCLDVWNYPRKVNKVTVPVLAALADETHKQGRRISVHCECPLDALDAVRVGADSIEHIINVGADPIDVPEELVQRIVSQGTFVVPTLTITGTYDGQNPKVSLALRHSQERDQASVRCRREDRRGRRFRCTGHLLRQDGPPGDAADSSPRNDSHGCHSGSDQKSC